MRKKKMLCIVIVAMFFAMNIISSWACSVAGATGDVTEDGRPVIWKNRDSWGTENCWKTFAYQHEAPSNSTVDKFNYVGVTDADTKVYQTDPRKKGDEKSDSGSIQPENRYSYYPWAGANEKGLGLVQTSAHTLSNDFQQDQGFTADHDIHGIDNKTLNHLILCGCETVDEVEQLLRDTNNGWGNDGSTARNTNSIIMVFDKEGSMATFEVSGSDFTRDNVDTTYEDQQDLYYAGEGAIYPQLHDDDKDTQNPQVYSGFDWRTNFAKVDYERADGFKFFVDNHRTKIIDDEIVNYGLDGDGIDDREYSKSAIKRYGRVGIRMDDDIDKDYQYFIQKYAGTDGIGENDSIETLARSIGNLPYENSQGETQKPTGYHVNRFCTTFSVVITGSKASDPDDGKLTTIWLAQGEPGSTIFIPIFPFAQEPPEILEDMYIHSNDKRRLVYEYEDTDDDGDDNECDGYSKERNKDHHIDLDVLTGDGYYGQGGIQRPIFKTEKYVYGRYDRQMDTLRNQLNDGLITDDELRQALKQWQESNAAMMKGHYINGTYPLIDER